MANIRIEDGKKILECSEFELLMLHQALNEIKHGFRTGEYKDERDLSEVMTRGEFERIDRIYSEAENLGFANPISIHVDDSLIHSYVCILRKAMQEFEGELQTRTGVTVKEANKLLSDLETYDSQL